MQYVWEMGKLLKVGSEDSSQKNVLYDEKKKIKTDSEEIITKDKVKETVTDLGKLEEKIHQSSNNIFSTNMHKKDGENKEKNVNDQIYERSFATPLISINKSLFHDVRCCLSASPSVTSCFSPGFSMRAIKPCIEYSTFSTPEYLSFEVEGRKKSSQSIRNRNDTLPAIVVNKDEGKIEFKKDETYLTPPPLNSSGRLHYTSYPSLLTAPKPSEANSYQVLFFFFFFICCLFNRKDVIWPHNLLCLVILKTKGV
jgi:hypothetical protein